MSAAAKRSAHVRVDLDFHGLYLLVDSEDRQLGHLSFVGSGATRLDDKGRLVHVMSPHAGGEVRGFVIYKGAARLRLPSRPEAWPELDAVVSIATGLPIVNLTTTGGAR